MKSIVTTTINPPTQALRAFAEMENWTLIVIGDKKTPDDWSLEGAIYVSPQEQESRYPQLSKALGWNVIQRRNIGFLLALEMKSTMVATVDDDNIPLQGWGESTNSLLGRPVEIQNFFGGVQKVFDPISVTNYPDIWHRGFPIQELTNRNYERVPQEHFEFDVQADFWNGDPDIDAICRMEHAPDCVFDDNYFPIASSLISPFNSQNTFLTEKALRHYFMFPSIGRMDDIWAAYYLQAIGFKVVYSKASVRQDRNAHDLTRDFEQEVLGYTHNLKLLSAISENPENIRNFLPETSWRAFI